MRKKRRILNRANRLTNIRRTKSSWRHRHFKTDKSGATPFYTDPSRSALADEIGLGSVGWAV